MEMYYVREYTPTCRFLKIIDLILTGLVIIFKNLQLKCILHYIFSWHDVFSLSRVLYVVWITVLIQFNSSFWVVTGFVDIGGIVDRHCLNFL
jgi:hypothetical protein